MVYTEFGIFENFLEVPLSLNYTEYTEHEVDSLGCIQELLVTYIITYDPSICSDREMLCIYSDIVLMGVGVLYLWATDSGPRLP